jgi:hypothetical protein
MLTTTILAALVATLAACGGGDSSSTGPGGNTPRTDTPAELVGGWVHGFISPTIIRDADTGDWVDSGYGTSVLFTFTADGRYTQDILIKTSAYSCRTQVYVHNEGTTTITGNEIRVYPTKGRVVSRDTCNDRFNFDRADDIGRKQGNLYLWHFAENPEDGKTYLMIDVNASGNLAYFRPAD